MALRFCLVGLVVTLGFELPSGEDVSACVRSGWNWVCSTAWTTRDRGGFARSPEGEIAGQLPNMPIVRVEESRL